MKLQTRLLSMICLSTCITAYAQGMTKDDSANLEVTGTVKSSDIVCDLSLSMSSIALRDIKISALPAQGGSVPPTIDSIGIHLKGDKCSQTSVRFIGETDNTAHNTLINSSQTSSAAKGVGIGIYDMNGDALDFTKSIPSVWNLYSEVYPIYTQMVKLADVSNPTGGDVQASLTVQLENL
ncbi:fimbrial protein [Lelliottia amnigena]|uniref:Fimbrial protein n=2 Tax=Lelliottia amnigena TaxID=61646 RepID=A0ABU7U6D6_LELAM